MTWLLCYPNIPAPLLFLPSWLTILPFWNMSLWVVHYVFVKLSSSLAELWPQAIERVLCVDKSKKFDIVMFKLLREIVCFCRWLNCDRKVILLLLTRTAANWLRFQRGTCFWLDRHFFLNEILFNLKKKWEKIKFFSNIFFLFFLVFFQKNQKKKKSKQNFFFCMGLHQNEW